MTKENDVVNQELACDPSLSRKEFLSKVIKGAALTGGFLVAPKVLDKFLVQAVAAASSCTGPNKSVKGPPSGCTDTGGNACYSDGLPSSGTGGCAGQFDSFTTAIGCGDINDTASCSCAGDLGATAFTGNVC